MNINRNDDSHMTTECYQKAIAERDAKINRLSCENDNLHERIRKLEDFHMEHSEHITIKAEKPCDKPLMFTDEDFHA